MITSLLQGRNGRSFTGTDSPGGSLLDAGTTLATRSILRLTNKLDIMAGVSMEALNLDLKNAMIAHDDVRVRTLRSIKAAVQSREIEKGRGTLTEADILAVLEKQARQRRDAMAQFDSAGRQDLFSREKEELAIIETYLPEQLSQDDLDAIIKDAISATGAQSVRDMGRVMGVVMPKVRGRADGNLVRQTVSRLLG